MIPYGKQKIDKTIHFSFKISEKISGGIMFIS